MTDGLKKHCVDLIDRLRDGTKIPSLLALMDDAASTIEVLLVLLEAKE